MPPGNKTKQKSDNKNLSVIQTKQQTTVTKTDSLPAPEQNTQTDTSTVDYLIGLSLQRNEMLKNSVDSSLPPAEAVRTVERSSLPRTYSNPEKPIVKYYRTWQESKALRNSEKGKFVTRKSITTVEDFEEQRRMRDASSNLVENGMEERTLKNMAREKAKLSIPFLKGYHAKTDIASPSLYSPVSRKDMDIRDKDQEFVNNLVSETGQGRMIAVNQMLDTFMKREIPARQLTEKYVCSHVRELVDRIEQAGAIKELISQYEKYGSDVDNFGSLKIEEMAQIKNKVERELSLREFITPVLILNGMTLGWSERLNRLELTSGADTGSNDKHYYKEQADNAWKKLQSLKKEHAAQEEKIKDDRIWGEREALMNEVEGAPVVDLDDDEIVNDDEIEEFYSLEAYLTRHPEMMSEEEKRRQLELRWEHFQQRQAEWEKVKPE